MIFPNKSTKIPKISNQNRLEIGLEKLCKEKSGIDFSKECPQTRLAKSILSSSPYLSKIFIENQDLVKDCFENGLEDNFYNLIDKTKQDLKNQTDTQIIKKELRLLKKRASLIIAMGEITQELSIKQTTYMISFLAKQALDIAICHLFYKAYQKKKIIIEDDKDILKNCGYVVIGMGKLGADELNYSSDVDLIILYDERKIEYIGRKTEKYFFIDITKELVKIFEERTPDGYVFRVDLRLRPDPASTTIAMNVFAAETYYECFGQNWERAAMIKATPVAGDKEIGEEFLKHITPFVWRRSLDFKAIKDIHAIKRQIRSNHKTCYIENLKGHNIKLGKGGIREIEFFAQTQQLIWGGKKPNLRKKQTCQTLRELEKEKFIKAKTAQEMIDSYIYLRKLEHRLQMVEDAQTQKIPKDEQKAEEIAIFMGFDNYDEFKKKTVFHLEKVEKNYSNLFNDDKNLSKSKKLVFTGNQDDEQTLKNISDMGFSNPPLVALTVRNWYNGKIRATRSSQSRELLDELIYDMLKAFSNTTDADMAFLRFDDFFSSLPAGVQLLHLFHSNPALLELLAEIMGDAPILSKDLSKKPFLLDNVLQPDFFSGFPRKEELEKEFEAILKQSQTFEQTLDLSRSWTKAKSFQIGTLSLKNIINGKKAGFYLSLVTDVVLSALLEHVKIDFQRLYGKIRGADIAIIAMGKVGGREMTTSSDLDLIFVYDNPKNIEVSDGKKQISASQYYIRFVKKYLSSVTSMTAEGKLWDIDTRLRPSGNAGPLATSFEAFEKYQKNDAWTWEHMALTRARIVTSTSEKLENKINKAIKEVLSYKRDEKKLINDIRQMKQKLLKNKKTQAPWCIKHMKGGMVDIEFIAQYLMLKNAHKNQELIKSSTTQAIETLAIKKIITKEQEQILTSSYELLLDVKNMFSQTIKEEEFDENKASLGLKRKLAEVIGKKDIEDLEEKITNNNEKVAKIYDDYIG